MYKMRLRVPFVRMRAVVCILKRIFSANVFVAKTLVSFDFIRTCFNIANDYLIDINYFG